MHGSDSRLLLEWAMERPMERILLEEGRGLSPLEASRLEEGAARRLAGEPVQYITRRAYFYGRPFYVEKGVLIPRRDTETLVAAAQKKLHAAARVLDLCCGSGCVGISLALEGEYAVTASDISRPPAGLRSAMQRLWARRSRYDRGICLRPMRESAMI